MLDEFVNDVKKTLQARLDSERSRLEGTPENGDKTRGAIGAYRLAIADLEEQFIRYQAPESVPAHLQEQPQRRTYGSRRVA